jgi:hypothetical protein
MVDSVPLHPKKGKKENFCLGYFFDMVGRSECPDHLESYSSGSMSSS